MERENHPPALEKPEPGAALRLGTTKAALKSPALQTLRADEALPYCASASGVRATSAPLWFSDGSNQGFRGSKREDFVRRILSQRERVRVRENGGFETQANIFRGDRSSVLAIKEQALSRPSA